MFEKPTVFILGAGASWHYNYPTGEDLVRRVVEQTNKVVDCFQQDSRAFITGGQMPVYFSKNFPQSSNQIHEILAFLNNFIDRITHVDPPVIDYFLEWNKDLQEIGKLMIAWVILEREREYILRKGNENRARIHQESSDFEDRKKRVDILAFKDNWYRFLLYKMVSQCKESNRLKENQVQFITFNYDVSLESYLYKGLRQIEFLKKNEGDIKGFLENRFVHMYGQIRENAFVDPVPVIEPIRGRAISHYKDVLDVAYEASQGIKTIGDDKDDDEAKRRAEVIIDWAEDVYILGYGFDEVNSSRLALDSLLSVEALDQSGHQKEKRLYKRVYYTNFNDSNSVNKKAGRLLTGDAGSFLPDQPAIYNPNGYTRYRCDALYEKSVRNVYDALERDFDFF